MISQLFILSLLAFIIGGYLAIAFDLPKAYRSKQDAVNAIGAILLVGGFLGMAWAALA